MSIKGRSPICELTAAVVGVRSTEQPTFILYDANIMQIPRIGWNERKNEIR